MPRPSIREKKARRSHRPTDAMSAIGFRGTITPPGLIADVQPAQVGVPDIAVPTLPVRRKTVAEDPWAPVGIRIGNINFFPVFGQSAGYDANPNLTQLGRHGSFVSRTEAELGVQSDWSRHELSGFLSGAYNVYPSNEAANRPQGTGRIGLRLDATHDTQFDGEVHYQIDTQRPGSPDLNAVVRERPNVYTEGASVGVTQRFNRIVASLRGTLDRSDFDDAKLANGTTLDQSDRNMTQYGGRLRVGYEVKPGLLPFVQVDGDTRVYDHKVDDNGYRRSSDGVSARLGSTFEISPLLTGEISAGVANRSYQDPRLRDLLSPVGNAALAYALTPITTIRATAQASVDETTVPGANGIRSIKGGLEISHDLRRNLTVTAGVSAGDYKYQGVSIDEQSFAALLRADYRLTRQVALRASYNYEHYSSSVAGSGYVSNVFLLGIRLQP